MSLIKDSLFKEGPAPETVIMIDPFLKAVDWRLPLVEYVGPILGNLYKRHSAERKPYWYSYIHYKPCVQLNNLAKEVTGALNKGLLLPEGTKVVCYTAQGDPIVDVESSVTIVSGLKSRNNEKIEHVWINSNRHVFTSLLGKDVSAKDASNQKKVFKEIVDYLNRNAPSL